MSVSGNDLLDQPEVMVVLAEKRAHQVVSGHPNRDRSVCHRRDEGTRRDLEVDTGVP